MNADDKIESPYYDSSIPRFKQLKMMRHSEMVIDGGGLEVQQYHNYKDWYLKDQNGWQYVNTQDLGISTELAWVGNGQDGETGPPIAGNAQGNGGDGWTNAAQATLGFIAADAAIPEPSDAFLPKWVVYAAAGATSAAILYYAGKGNANYPGPWSYTYQPPRSAAGVLRNKK